MSAASATDAPTCGCWSNDRPCGGAPGWFCDHILALVNDVVLRYGAERLARYLCVAIVDAEPSAA